MVGVYLYGAELSPDEVSRLVGAEPTKSWKKGEGRKTKSSIGVIVAKTGLWKLQAVTRSSKLEDHIDELLNKFHMTSYKSFSDLPGVDAAKLDIYALCETTKPYSSQVLVRLSKMHMEKLSELGLIVDVTFECCDSEEI